MSIREMHIAISLQRRQTYMDDVGPPMLCLSDEERERLVLGQVKLEVDS